MIVKFTDNLFVGDSQSIKDAPYYKITAVLNTAFDLDYRISNNPDKYLPFEYYKVGFTDGEPTDEYAIASAVIFLDYLLSRPKTVLVLCHEGRSRSVVVATLWYAGKCAKGNLPRL